MYVSSGFSGLQLQCRLSALLQPNLQFLIVLSVVQHLIECLHSALAIGVHRVPLDIIFFKR
jgi:hypothetical protein